MAQDPAQDSGYQLPTPAGNTGPSSDVAIVVNTNGQTVIRQRMEVCYTGQTAVVTAAEGNLGISSKPGALVSVLVTAPAGGGAITFYDSTGPNGKVIGIIPGNAAVTGVPYVLNMPVTTGIFAFAAASSAAATVNFQQ